MVNPCKPTLQENPQGRWLLMLISHPPISGEIWGCFLIGFGKFRTFETSNLKGGLDPKIKPQNLWVWGLVYGPTFNMFNREPTWFQASIQELLPRSNSSCGHFKCQLHHSSVLPVSSPFTLVHLQIPLGWDPGGPVDCCLVLCSNSCTAKLIVVSHQHT